MSEETFQATTKATIASMTSGKTRGAPSGTTAATAPQDKATTGSEETSTQTKTTWMA